MVIVVSMKLRNTLFKGKTYGTLMILIDRQIKKDHYHPILSI
jgi:hypothetical protein